MKEEWKPVVGYEGIYEVSNMGRVRSLSRRAKTWFGSREVFSRIRKTFIHKNGYEYIVLSKKGKNRTYRIHRLVAEAFCSNPNSREIVHHLNRKPDDNHASNLIWVNQMENIGFSVQSGTRAKGEGHGMAILTKQDVLEIRDKYIPRKYSYQKLGDEYGVDQSTIHLIVKRRKWNHI